MSYTCYHLHSDLSLLDSCSKFSEYVDLAKQQGMKAIGTTEHGIPRSWVEKKITCDNAGIKLILGVEIYITMSLDENIRDNYHTVLLARNEDGIHELNELIELSTRPDHFYYNNRITAEEFLSISPNIIKISACLASPLARLDPSDPMYLRLARHYDFLEVQHHNVPDQVAYNKRLMQLSRQLNKPLIAGTDTHSASEYKAKCREILMEYKEQHYPGEDGFDLVWKTEDELIEAFEKQGALPRSAFMEAIANTNVMADMVEDFKLDKSPKYPILYGSAEADEKKLTEVTYLMLAEKISSGIIPESQADTFYNDCAEELEAFHQTNMSGFMLSMSEIISWCRNSGIPIGPCRGSVGGSRVAYVTDIIDMNPVTYNTVFSRFCNSARVELGDIDCDCIDTDRPKIFEHIVNKFGEKYCARVAAYGTIADLSFIDDCGGGLAIIWEREHHPEKFRENGRMDKVKYEFDAKNPYNPKKLLAIKKEYREDPDATMMKYPDLFYYYDGMAGTRISQSVHPAGMVISCETLDDHWGVFNKDGSVNIFPVRHTSMKGKITTHPNDLINERQLADEMDSKMVKARIDVLRRSGEETRAMETALQFKYSAHWMNLIVLLIGAALCHRYSRSGGLSQKFGVGLLLVFSYYILERIGLKMGENGALSPFWAAWNSHFIYAGLAFVMLYRSFRL